ncbi:MAG: hydrogenase iron-sulfur subunit [Chthonomonadales bacterium]|nr:hydrogenase iron-sulfur subunit [Chthonomonadales bacterium]
MRSEDDLKILIITTLISSYPGANTVGQARLQYSPGTYIIRVPDPVMFPDDFYIQSLKKGIDGIIVMSSGSDCPYEGAYARLSARISRVYGRMKELGIPTNRLKLTTVCTVCKAAFLKEIREMQQAVLSDAAAAAA